MSTPSHPAEQTPATRSGRAPMTAKTWLLGCLLPLGLVAAVIAVIVAIVGGHGAVTSPPAAVGVVRTSTSTARPATTASTTYNGAAAVLRSAGPLDAHLGGPDGNSVLCNSDSATATGVSGGVEVVLTFPGPADMQASILAGDGRSQDISYTESSQEQGHTFDFPGFTLTGLQTLDVNVTSALGTGTCYLVDNMS